MKTTPSTLEQLECRQFFAIGGSYVAPVTPRLVINENAQWQHAANGLVGAAVVDLPFVRDATNAKTGTDVFTKVIPTTAAMAGKKIFLHFEGAYLSTSVSIDGVAQDFLPAAAGTNAHDGGYSAFDFDVTNAMAAVGNHTVVVTVASSGPNTIPGQVGDYSHQGGIYRDVSLIVTNPTHVALYEDLTHNGAAARVSSPGVRFSNDDVVIGAAGTTVHVSTVLDNQQVAGKNVSVATYLVDAAGVIRAQEFTSNVAETNLGSNQTGVTLTQNLNVSNPHLWDGRIDPYLYTLYVEVHDASSYRLLDLQKQKVGIRTIKINNPQTAAQAATLPPFVLNGHAYRVVGADMHQDTAELDSRGDPAGWERSDAQTRSDIDLLADMGGTGIRTSHYQDSQAFYDYCDLRGILVYTEVAIQDGNVNVSKALDQYDELIRQNYNHPSVFAWGMGNEYGLGTTLAQALQDLAGGYGGTGLDPHRYTSVAQGGNSSPTGGNGVPDLLSSHPYTYWYGNGQGPGVTSNSTTPRGVTEYGGGGATYQYADSFVLPKSQDPNGISSRYHPQNQQAQIEQRQYTELTALGFIWGQFTWQMFDASSTGKNEGEATNTNDKGLVSRDRIPKDSYFFYKANLNDPTRNYANLRVLKLSDQFWTTRNSPTPTITVYSNIGAPTLNVNGTQVGMTQLVLNGVAIPSTYTVTLAGANALQVGQNSIRVSRSYNGQSYTDSAVWSYRNAITGTPTARVDFGTAALGGYLLDNGAAYTAQRGYGWLPVSGKTLAVGGTFPTPSGTTKSLTTDGVALNSDILYKTSSVWEYALANGTYDVQIGAGQSGKTDGVNNFTLEGKTAAIDTNGLNGTNAQDTFFARVTVTDNKLTLAAAPGAFNARITYININAVTDTIKPLVSKITVNNNDSQRSNITALSIQFTEPVTLGAGAVTLSQRGTANTYALTMTTTDDGSTYNLAAATALPDGVYDVIVNSALVTDKSGNAMAGLPSNIAGTFTKLFGDANGDRVVNAQDTQLFGLARGTKTGQLGYKNFLDYDGDGDIDAVDQLRFNGQNGKTVVA